MPFQSSLLGPSLESSPSESSNNAFLPWTQPAQSEYTAAEDWLAPFLQMQHPTQFNAFSEMGFAGTPMYGSNPATYSDNVFFEDNAYLSPMASNDAPVLEVSPVLAEESALQISASPESIREDSSDESQLVEHFLETLSVWAVMRDKAAPNYYHSVSLTKYKASETVLNSMGFKDLQQVSQ